MISKKLARLATVGAVAATMIAVSALPASANSDKIIYLPGGRGYMKFHDDGDVFEVCDTKADGHGVTGTLLRFNPLTADRVTVLVVTDGGDSGCGKKGYDIGNFYSYNMTVSWNGGGDSIWSESFNE